MGKMGDLLIGSMGFGGRIILKSIVPSCCMPRARRGSIVIAFVSNVIYGFVLLICRRLMNLIF